MSENSTTESGLPAQKDNFDFGVALVFLKRGERVARAGWNGKGMFIFLNKGCIHVPEDSKTIPQHIEGIDAFLFDHSAPEGTTTRLPNLNMRSASGATVTGWLASQTDILAEDWCLVE